MEVQKQYELLTIFTQAIAVVDGEFIRILFNCYLISHVRIHKVRLNMY